MADRFFADFHVHSKYSIATSKKADLFNYSYMARVKGIQLVGTGDGTHPGWLSEMEEFLVRDEQTGFYVLNDKYENELRNQYNYEFVKKKNYFIPTSEISTIYKKNGKVRKLHHLFIFPDLEKMKEFSSYLDERGNVRSDGRPILGFHSDQLLEAALTVCPDVIYVPAHIWTPHFSVYGAKSGFDSLEECYGPLIKHIYAVETGLSSDPPMNWRISELDGLYLLSNSDAHGPNNLGREANVFYCDFSFEGILKSLRNDDYDQQLRGTIEFFPEQGKYHYDGHRKCGISLTPEEAFINNYICPVCHKPLTYGVYHRVMELADKPPEQKSLKSRSFKSIIPLPQILSECLNKGVNTKTVQNSYFNIIKKNGSEFDLLLEREIDSIISDNPFLKIAIERMRESNIHLKAGFDGEYGKAVIFTEEEKKSILSKSFYKLGTNTIVYKNVKKKKSAVVSEQLSFNIKEKKRDKTKEVSCNKEQSQAVHYEGNTLFVQAGPGTGKTFSLVERVKFLSHSCPLEEILAVSFTEKASRQIKEKMNIFKTHPSFGTFHSISLSYLKDHGEEKTVLSEWDQIKIIDMIIEKSNCVKSKMFYKNEIEKRKSSYMDSFFFSEDSEIVYREYENYLQKNKLMDYDDILIKFINLFKKNNENKFKHLLIDEIQDCGPLQYEWIRTVGKNVYSRFFIGDFYQSIYQFRGAKPELIFKLKECFPDLEEISLKTTYRLNPGMIKASNSVIDKKPIKINLTSNKKDDLTTVDVFQHPNGNVEKSFLYLKIKELAGLTDMNLISQQESQYALNDIAVLFRTKNRLKEYSRYFVEKRLPVHVHLDYNWLSNEKVVEMLTLLRAIGYKDILFYQKIFKDYYDKSIRFDDLRRIKDFSRLFDKAMSVLEWEREEELVELKEHLTGFKDWSREVLRLMGNQVTTKIDDNLQLMTIHSSKGLEFPVVIIPSLEDGYIPLVNNENKSEEENLFYVGCTRASRKLILSLADFRNNKKKSSLFLQRIKNHVNWKKNYPKNPPPKQLKLF